MIDDDASVDVLGDTLRALKVEGMVLLRECYTPPFTVAVPSADELAASLRVPSGARVVAFHLSEIGTFELRFDGREAVAVAPGEAVFCFGESAHRLARGETPVVVGFESLMATDAARTFGEKPAEREDQVRIVCGALVLHDTRLNPLFSSLPDVLHVGRDSPEGTSRVSDVTALLVSELERADPAGDYVVERLLEVLCAEGIRRFAARQHEAVGWFHGLADRQVNRALAAFHADPGAGWSIARLAQSANLSPSRFAARFAAATSESVMAYVTRWRMNLAMRALRHSDDGVAAIAGRVGYESLPAFSRAFKRHVGISPGAFRASSSSGPDR